MNNQTRIDYIKQQIERLKTLDKTSVAYVRLFNQIEALALGLEDQFELSKLRPEIYRGSL